MLRPLTTHHLSLLDISRIARQSLWLPINLSLLMGTLFAQDIKELPTLEQGKPIECELAGDAANSYSIKMSANQFIHVVVEQKGIDLVVRLFGPDGKQLIEVDSPNGSVGPEPVSFITEVAGNYRLEVRSLDANVKAGRYQVKIEELRAAKPQDSSRIAAQLAFAEGEQLESERSADSHRKAIEKYQTALTLWRAANDRSKEADTLTIIGQIYDSLGEKQEALDYYNRALPLLRAVGDSYGEAYTLNGIGVVYDSLGEKWAALNYFKQALPINRAVGDRGGEAATLHNMAGVYSSLGEKQKALDNYNQALPLFRAVGDRNEAYTLGNIGFIFYSLGERQKSLDYYNQALPLFRAAGDLGGESYTLNNIGLAYDSLGEKQKALDYYNQSLSLKRNVGDRRGEAITLKNIGGVYFSLGEKQKALDYFYQALPITRAVGDRGGEAYTLNNIGYAYSALGEKQKALDYYKQALPRRRAVGDRSGEAITLANIATVERDRGNLTEARARIEEALVIVESLRTKIASQELRSSYFATVQHLYRLHIDILMRLHKLHPLTGYDGEALQASERGRARSLLETLTEASADIRQGVDPALVARERLLQQQLNAKAQTQMALLNGPHTDAQADAIAKEVETLTTEYQHIQATIRQKSPNYAALTHPQPLSPREIQTKVLDKDTLLLEYSLGEEHSYLWAVTQTSVSSYELPKREEIETGARRVYELLNARNKRVKDETQMARDARIAQADRDVISATSELSRIVLASVAAQLGKKRLVIVTDGVLQYIPFAALPAPSVREAVPTVSRSRANRSHKTGARTESRPYESNTVGAPLRGRPLIVDHEIVNLPSASTLAVLRREVAGRKPATKSVVALADPVFAENDDRVKSGNIPRDGANEVPKAADGETVRELQLVEAAEDTGVASDGLNITRLPGSRREAEQIVAMVPASESKLALDFEANRSTATSEELSRYRYVHFSTHGFLNSVHPELSGLVFSLVNEKGETQDGFLRAHEVFNLKLPAELVVLSACQTGIGKEVKGEGLVSLTRGFMYAGAPRVVVSLWSVSEMGTTELMVRFYREMLKKGLRPAAALRAAQISLMKEKRWASPFYWAPFTLQGEWR